MGALLPRDGYSRRRFVRCGAASFLFPTALANAQSIAPGASLPPDEAAKIAADEDAANHLTINVTLNGKGPFRFVVDTGADRSVIAEDVAGLLGLLHQRQVMVEGVVRTIPAQTVRLGNISFGPVSRDNLDVPILPRGLLGADGYLGLDTIDGYRVTLDFKNRALEVSQPRHAQPYSWAPPDEVLVPVAGRFGHLRSISCKADGIRTTAFIDTGAEVSVGNAKLLEALMEVSPTYLKLETVPLTGVTGGVVQGHITTINRVHLNALILDTCNILIADLQIFDLWGLSGTPALLIGMNFLREFSQVSIDYGCKELRFELARLVIARRT
ncbi:MAG: aspartyl protease family protein [Rhizomicrobium sp.]|jgi:predicted aspartyl protease